MKITATTAAVLLLLSAATTSIDAFSPMGTISSLKASMLAATREKLSPQESEVLFGESSSRSRATVSSSSSSNNSNNSRIPRPAKLEPGSLDYATSDPLINDLRRMRDTVTHCPQLWERLAELCPDRRALLDEHMCDTTIDVTFAQMHDLVLRSASIFQSLGVKKGQNVAILGENSARWLMADHGIQLAGGASAVRGADAPADELRYIYSHSDSAGIVVLQGPRLMQKLAKDAAKNELPSSLGLSNESHGNVRTVILLHREKKTDDDIQQMATDLGVQVQVFADLLDSVSSLPPALPEIGLTDLSTIVYTSGTTGSPKGVMLEHGNLLHQIGHRTTPSVPYEQGEPLPGETMVSLLPVWHITERTFELWMFSRGCNVVYSSIRSFKKDLAKHQPEWMVLVPRVLEKIALGVQDKFAKGSSAVQTLVKIFTATSSLKVKHSKISRGIVVGDEAPNGIEKLKSKVIVAALAPLNAVGDKLVWSKVQDGFGGKLKTIISGGSALAGSLESFYENCGLNIIVGYGLTECSPLLAHRRSDTNLVTPGCTGLPTFDTEIRAVDPDALVADGERPALPDGTPGVILGRGPQVMRGYYKNPEATAKAIDEYGWFDTGDLGKINPVTGDLILTGRAKDTIVLSNGENIEPSPIEDAIMGASPLIEQVMLLGQDGRKLLSIIVLNPNELVNAGYLQSADGGALQKASEALNDPKCSPESCAENSKILAAASERLRESPSLKKDLLKDIKVACKPFRAWEQVNECYITLEPFAMANGQLTQSYKVKRDSVMDRYGDELE